MDDNLQNPVVHNLFAEPLYKKMPRYIQKNKPPAAVVKHFKPICYHAKEEELAEQDKNLKGLKGFTDLYQKIHPKGHKSQTKLEQIQTSMHKLAQGDNDEDTDGDCPMVTATDEETSKNGKDKKLSKKQQAVA